MRDLVPSFSFLLLLAGLILSGGCSRSSTQEEKANEAVQQSHSATASDSSQNLKSWPADIPGNVPKLAGGNVYDVSRSDLSDGTTWGVTITNTSREEVINYQEILRTAGWKTGSGLIDENGIIFGANLDKTRIDVAWAAENKAANITVLVKK